MIDSEGTATSDSFRLQWCNSQLMWQSWRNIIMRKKFWKSSLKHCYLFMHHISRAAWAGYSSCFPLNYYPINEYTDLFIICWQHFQKMSCCLMWGNNPHGFCTQIGKSLRNIVLQPVSQVNCFSVLTCQPFLTDIALSTRSSKQESSLAL